MKPAASSVLPVNVLNNDRSQSDYTAKVIGLSSRKKSVDLSDPCEMYRLFPARWRQYLHTHYKSHLHVSKAFGVCEKAGRKWWDGVGGPRGDKVAIAMERHPKTAAVILFQIPAE